jgi:hypothetical protein
MRVAAMVLGILGGLAGLAGIVVAGAGAYFPFNAVLFAPLGLVGAGLALRRPGVAGILMLAAGLGLLVVGSPFALLAAPLLVAGAVEAYFGWRAGDERR